MPRRMLGTVARTAVISSTATAASGRVARKQAAKFADQDAATAAQRQAAYDAQTSAAPQPPPTAATAPAGAMSDEVVAQLRQLAELHQQGILTDDEFAAQKAKLLG